MVGLDSRAAKTIYEQRRSVTGVAKELFWLAGGGRRQVLPGKPLPEGVFCVSSKRRGRRKVFCYLPDENKFTKLTFGEQGRREIEAGVRAVRFLEEQGLGHLSPSIRSVNTGGKVSVLSSELLAGSRAARTVAFEELCPRLDEVYGRLEIDRVPASDYLDTLEERIRELEKGRSAPLRLLTKLKTVFEGDAIFETYTHGDLGPSNVLPQDGRIVIIDWTTLDVRSLMYDAAEFLRRGCGISEGVDRIRRKSGCLKTLFPTSVTDRDIMAYYGLALLEHELEIQGEWRQLPRIREYNKKQFRYVSELLE